MGSRVRFTLTENAATTTARMPDACASSATRYAVNGSSSTSDVSSVALPSRLRMNSVATGNSPPMPIPTSELRSRSSPPLCHEVCSPRTAPIAMVNSVSAVASLTRLSPVRIEVTRLGSPISSPCDTVGPRSRSRRR